MLTLQTVDDYKEALGRLAELREKTGDEERHERCRIAAQVLAFELKHEVIKNER